MNRILITGASGFIGSVLCGRLASGNKIVVVDITAGPADGALNIIWGRLIFADKQYSCIKMIIGENILSAGGS